MGLLSGLASFGKGLLGKAVDWGFNQGDSALAARRQYDYNKKLMQFQYNLNEQAAKSSFDRSIQAWNMENEYNTPKNQMMRFVEAGLNPHLIYGQTNTASSLTAPDQKGVSGSSVSGNMPGSSSRLLDNISTVLSFRNIKKQGDIMDRDILLKKAQEGEINQRIAESRIRTLVGMVRFARSSFDYKLAKQTLSETLMGIRLRNYLSYSNIIKNYYDSQIRSREWSDYNNLGIRPNDPWYLRSFTTAARKAFKGYIPKNNDSQFLKDFANMFNY